jgi:O-antigen ligase
MQFRNRISLAQGCSWSVFALLIFSVLWRGGKSLETTWIALGVVSILTVLYQCKTRNRKEAAAVPPVLWCTMVLLILLTAVSYLTSVSQNYGLDEVLRTGAMGLLFFWVIRFCRCEGEESAQSFIWQLIRIIGTVTLLACGIGLLVYVFQPVDRFVGTFFDHRFHTDYWPNAWADFLLLTWPIVYYWSFRTWSFRMMDTLTVVEVVCRCIAVGIVVGCMLLSYSRGGLMAFSGQLGLWFLLYYLSAREEFPRKKVASLAVIIAVVATSVFFGANALRKDVYEVQSVTDKVTLSSAEGASSVTERVQFWSQAVRLAAEKPLTGWGPYSFRFMQPRMQTSVLATSDHPHNIFLKYAAERGIISALLLLFIVGFVLLRACKQELADGRENAHHSSLGIVLIVSLSGLLAHNLIDYNLQFVGIALLFWLLLGVLAYRTFEGEPKCKCSLQRLVECSLVIVLLLTAVIEGGYLVISSIGRHAEARGEIETALKWYEKAEGEWFSRDLHLSRAKLLLEGGASEKSREAVQDYFVQNSEDARAWKRLGDIERQEGDFSAAIEAYEKAYTLGRFNDISIVQGIIEVLLLTEKYTVITERRQEFESLLQRFGNAIVLNTHFIALSPNVESFITLSERFAKLYPDEAPLYVVLAAKADHNSELERERLAARPPGFLW